MTMTRRHAIMTSAVAVAGVSMIPSAARAETAWFGLRFMIGAAGSVLWVSGEAWINQVADDTTRGRVVALYSMAVAGGFALGPVVLSVTGSQGRFPRIRVVSGRSTRPD